MNINYVERCPDLLDAPGTYSALHWEADVDRWGRVLLPYIPLIHTAWNALKQGKKVNRLSMNGESADGSSTEAKKDVDAVGSVALGLQGVNVLASACCAG